MGVAGVPIFVSPHSLYLPFRNTIPYEECLALPPYRPSGPQSGPGQLPQTFVRSNPPFRPKKCYNLGPFNAIPDKVWSRDIHGVA